MSWIDKAEEIGGYYRLRPNPLYTVKWFTKSVVTRAILAGWKYYCIGGEKVTVFNWVLLCRRGNRQVIDIPRMGR